MKFNFSFKNRPFAFYLKFAVGALATFLSILFFILECAIVRGHISFADNSHITFIFTLVGGISMIFAAFSEISFLPIISSICLAVGVGQHLFMSCYPYADLGTGVPFFVDDGTLLHTVADLFTIFLILFGILLVASLVCNFIDKKTEEKVIA